MSWVTAKLGDFAPFEYGKSLPKRARVTDGHVDVYGSGGVDGKHDKALTNGPTIIVGRKGSVGKVYFSSTPCWPIDTTYFIEGEDHLSARFKYYVLQTLGLDQLNYDSAVPGLKRDQAHSIQMQVPSADLQRHIATALGTFDDLIENNRRRIEVLEEMARLLYREWFVCFRFPGHEDVGLVDSDLGLIPEGWEVRSFAELADFVNGFAFKPEHWLDEGLPIIKIKELKNGVTADTPRYHGADISEKYFVDDGSVLFSWSADLKAYVWTSGPGLLNQHLFDVLPYEVSPLFVFLSLNERMDEFRARAQGTTMKHIKRSALGEVKVALPKKKLRDEFEGVARPVLDLQLNLSKQNRALREVRDLLLPRLVSGELDVSEFDLGLEAAGA